MTTPDNPYGDPGQNPPPPPTYGQQPAYGQPPAYGSPQYGAPQAGQPVPYGQAPYGQPPYGAPPAGNFGGTLAEWLTRVAGTLIDGIAVAIPGLVVFLIGSAANAGIIVFLGVLVWIAAWAWNLVRQGQTGQTVGKQVMGTYLVREADGQYVGAGLSILRYFVHIIDGLPCYVGYLWPLWDAKKQTFADKIMGTVVVKR
ncbi:MAG: hypothetical protein QOI76_3800 [Frankiales bacterium]|nr:hypothetical protein [Frankiales bacterium]